MNDFSATTTGAVQRRQAAEAAAKRAKAAAAAEAAATATREAEAFTNQIITAMTPILPIGAVKRLVDQIAQRERITIYWLSDDHRQQSASASPAGRYVRLHPIRTMADCACALHEIGHVVNGVCPGTGRHLRDVRVTTSFACLECERRSWEIGLQLFPFSAPMYQELSRTLRTYVGNILAPPDTELSAARLSSSTMGWCSEQQRRLRWQLRFDKQRLVMQELERM